MKLSDIKNGNLSAEWAEKGYELPKFDVEAVKAKTHAEPTWVHFGAGNIFRAFPAAILNDALNSGKYDRGVIVAESFDYEIIDKAYQPYDNLSLLVCLKSTGDIEKKVIASVTESLKADYSFGEDWARLVEIFQNPSLQMISFTITEKGYGVAPADLERGLTPVLAMGKVTALLYERFKAGKLPLTVQSMDNCSHNGDKVKSAVHAYASKWVEQGLVPAEFLAYVQDETKITFPWSMIDKITPRPDAKVQDMLAKDGFEDNYTIVTEKHTFTAPFVNAEETQYLCIEDHYTNGRPPLELGGVLYCDRETVDKIEKMKVCTCLNPLHTAMSIYGCMLGYTLISAEMADEDLRSFIQKVGYIEAMPVVVDPGVLNPYEFIGAVIGPGGKIIQQMQEDTGATITIEETDGKGHVQVSAPNKDSIDAALAKIKAIVAVPEVGEVYEGTVRSIMPYGCFVEILPGKDGLLHISEIDWKRLETVDEAGIKEGDKIKVKLMEIDPKTGKYKLSHRVLMEKPEGYVERERRPRPERGERRGRRDERHEGRGERPARQPRRYEHRNDEQAPKGFNDSLDHNNDVE